MGTSDLRMRSIVVCFVCCLVGLSVGQTPAGQAKTLEDRFFKAVEKSDNPAIKEILAGGFPVNNRTSTGDLPLGWVAERCGREAIGIMVAAGAKVDGQDADGQTALMKAVQWQNTAAAEELLKRGARVRLRDKLQRTAMHFCVNWTQYDFYVQGTEERDASMVDEFIQAGADPEARDDQDRTPLMWAAGWSHLPSLKALIRSGAKIEARDKAGRTALTWAAGHGRKDPQVEELLRSGAKIRLIDALEFGDSELARQCMARGDDLKVRGPFGDTTLCRAAELGDLGLVKALASGVDVNARDDGGATALHLACGSRPGRRQTGAVYWPPLTAASVRPAIVRALIEAGAKPSLAIQHPLWNDGETPLNWAVRGSTVGVVRALIEGGADVNQVAHDRYGKPITALGSMILDMECRPGDPDRLAKAAYLLTAGADPARMGEKGPLARMLSAFGTSDEIVSLLLKKGLDVNAPDDYGTTPLMEAVVNPHAVKALLARGARVNARNRWKGTALMRAAAGGNLESARLLLAAGAKRSLRNENGKTAYDMATDQKHPDVAKLIGRER